ncbi:hypothetical protein HC028_22890 [Planosporangium flavigriseum]|uniref:DUF7711 domain-containing protein n=1 Tax=Planosporangium flavigriseum TaxID=373681 RepID=A0A8J3PNK1_9ACTN|nr:hypothetical protein [Planosporangium flavigriseum]NJC67325.1 hypothetical protein [Planosporangium flavigriseum]GIG75409.1 hypothetical protein Pfl04_38130 [Planosporangium flavigriseum]
MNWTRAVHHVESLAKSCADMATRPPSIFPLRVTQLWAVGDILGPPRELETVTVALSVDLPPEAVPWWSEPPGAQHWANATRLARNPITAWWRSAHAPVWNHRIVRPALVWDSADGVRADTLAALHDGRGESVRIPAPDPDALRERLQEELSLSLSALRTGTHTYEERRWSPGKLEPVADSLWRASDGYLDVLDAVQRA